MHQKLHALLRAVGLPVAADLANPTITHLTCDSRNVLKGSLFLGLPGAQVDGGRFWPQARAAGAAAAVISSTAADLEPPPLGEPVMVAPDPMAYWVGELAAAYWNRPSSQLDLIGVTGTNGKTTTTHLIEHLSHAVGQSTALFGTLVNRWPGHSFTATHTTAFADHLQSQLASAVSSGVQLAAMEVSSHALEQQRVAGCSFAGAIFTNLTQDHLDFHPTMESYFEAKARLFRAPLLQTSGARAVINVDDPWGKRLADELGEQCWRCSLDDDALDGGDAQLTLRDLEMTGAGVKGVLISPVGSGQFMSPLIGQFNLMNVLQAVAALLQRGLPLPALLEAVKGFIGVPGRMERVVLPCEDVHQMPTVLVDYAHTPDGLKNALLASRPFTRGRLICVFGCGGDRDRSKRPQMGAIAAQLADQILITSDNPRTEDPELILKDVVDGVPANTSMSVEVDRRVAIAEAIAIASSEDVVLIAGKGHEDYQILGQDKIHFDDREEASLALRRRINDQKN